MVRNTRLASRVKLKDLLSKLGIRSAEKKTMIEMMESLSDMVMNDFGKPDKIFMPGKVFDDMTKHFWGKK